MPSCLTDSSATHLSKFLSLVLRHKPETIGIQLDPQGWVTVTLLLEKMAQHGQALTREDLDTLVKDNQKQRFALSEDGNSIRANQGHSVAVELDYHPQTPPEILYHGTVARFLDSIRTQGLSKGQRHHVHLSADTVTAAKVGERRGKPVVLKIAAGQMHHDGHVFYRSANGVWLVEQVPPGYIGWES